MPVVAIIGALDTKGEEFAFLKEQIEKRGHETLTIDLGILEPPPFEPDVSRDDVAAAGGIDLTALAEAKDRGQAVAAMTQAAEAISLKLHGEGKFDAIIGMGGTAGSAMCSAAMRALPLGVPKVLVSTVAGTDVSGYVGVKDIVMIPSIVDVSGINSISGQVIAQAAGAVVGMVETEIPESAGKPLICASMFGNTTDCVEAARKIIEDAGYEVLVFHAVGTGGKTMESLIEAGYISGVLDVTTTEWADELVGGVLTAGSTRMEAAAKCGVPAIVVPGCLDMVNFWAPDTIPAKFLGRKFYEHNPNITLMRTTPEECDRLGKIFAAKVNMSTAPVEVFIPLKGISVIAAPDQPFHWPEADEALFGAIKSNLRDDIPVHELDVNINDAEFSKAVADGLLNMLK